jgi:hypothetical protein
MRVSPAAVHRQQDRSRPVLADRIISGRPYSSRRDLLERRILPQSTFYTRNEKKSILPCTACVRTKMLARTLMLRETRFSGL